MSDFTKLQKDKILNHLYKNFEKIDFDNIDQDIFLKKIGDLVFFYKKELLIKMVRGDGVLFVERSSELRYVARLRCIRTGAIVKASLKWA